MTEALPERADLVVVGAGAAGLWAAECAARTVRESGREPDVLLVEKTARTGTKVLASGGTRCNLTTTLAPQPAARTFGVRGARFLRTAFRVVPPEEVRSRFDGWGVPTVEAPLDKIFPESGRARDVRDALRDAGGRAGVRTVKDAPVEGLERPSGAGDPWTIHVAGGRVVRAPRVLLAPGGASYPRTGTTGDGYRWLEALGLEVAPPAPALAPLTSPAPWVRELTGIALQDTEARLRNGDGRLLGKRCRPVLFTHVGLSGPGAMDLSGVVAREVAAGGDLAGWSVQLDLVPESTAEALVAELARVAGLRGAPPVGRALGLQLPRRLVAAALVAAGLDPDVRVNELSRAQRHALVSTLKGLAVPIDGTAGFDRAEVTTGGLVLDALDPGTMRVRGEPGLWAFGEVIDLDGPIGGLNFQAAFATAELAARDAATG